jgi:hypothetical protein
MVGVHGWTRWRERKSRNVEKPEASAFARTMGKRGWGRGITRNLDRWRREVPEREQSASNSGLKFGAVA